MTLSETDFIRICKALADPQRLEILQMLARSEELTGTSVVAKCPIRQACVSHHLKELANANLVERRKDGQFSLFKFRVDTFRAYLASLEERLGPKA